jgi:hypothetical protein
MDYPANKAAMSLWIADLKAKMAPRRLAVSDGGAGSGRWSPTARRSTSSRAAPAGPTRSSHRRTGEAAVQVTSAPFDVRRLQDRADGKTIVVGQAVFPDCADWPAPRPSWPPRATRSHRRGLRPPVRPPLGHLERRHLQNHLYA